MEADQKEIAGVRIKIDKFKTLRKAGTRRKMIGKALTVSENNGSVNWQAAKDAGIEFVMIRYSYGFEFER
jgi:hypothetical protein